MIERLSDGSIVLTDDADPGRTQTLPSTASPAARNATITAFFGAHIAQEQTAWGLITPREFAKALFDAMVDEGALTQGEANTALENAVGKVKR
jgi:hypothetical protein